MEDWFLLAHSWVSFALGSRLLFASARGTNRTVVNRNGKNTKQFCTF